MTALKQQEAVPILNALHRWMQDQYQQVAPKSSTGKALAYSLKLWKRLMRYTENGLWRIDNNLVENNIRPVALGRKNYLFAGSHDTAKRAAIMYTFFGSCKLNNIEPRSWLTNVLDTIQDVKISELSALFQTISKNQSPERKNQYVLDQRDTINNAGFKVNLRFEGIGL